MKKVLALIMVLSMAVVCCSCGEAERDPSGISQEEFQKIDTGMTYSEVVEIVGGEGTKISESKDEQEDYIEHVYVYKFNGEIGGYAKFEFTKKSYKDILKLDFSGAELTSKTQSDLS